MSYSSIAQMPTDMQQQTTDHSIHSILARQLLTNCTSASSHNNDCDFISTSERTFGYIPWFVYMAGVWLVIVMLSSLRKFYREIIDSINDRKNAQEKERKRKDLIENRLIKKRVKQLGSSVGENSCHDLESGLGGAPLTSPRECRLQKTDLYLPAKQNDHQHDDDAIEGEDDDLVCTICWEKYKENDEICYSQNPECAHSFQCDCIKSWLETHDECPICRRNYLSPSGEESDCKCHGTSDTPNHSQQQESDPNNDRLRRTSALDNTADEDVAHDEAAEKDFDSNRSSNCTSLDSELSEDEETPSQGVDMEEISLDGFEQQIVDRV